MIVQLEEDAEFPDAITSLIGQTFMFGVYIEKDNATAEGVCYKFGKVWKDINLLKIGENSESGSTHTPYEAQVRHIYDPIFLTIKCLCSTYIIITLLI